jgi:Flp pilus assembly protein TadG
LADNSLVRDRFRSLRRDDRGQALVEFALTIPLLLFVLFVIIDFGLAINAQNSDTNLANLAARQGAVIGTATTATCGSIAQPNLTAYVDCEAAATAPSLGTPCNVTVSDPGGTSTSVYNVGDSVQISVSVPFNWLGLITGGVNNNLKVASLTSRTTITQSATMRMEQSASRTGFLQSQATPTC